MTAFSSELLDLQAALAGEFSIEGIFVAWYDDPDEWSTHSEDVLIRLSVVTEALQKTARTRVAAKTTIQTDNSIR